MTGSWVFVCLRHVFLFPGPSQGFRREAQPAGRRKRLAHPGISGFQVFTANIVPDPWHSESSKQVQRMRRLRKGSMLLRDQTKEKV